VESVSDVEADIRKQLSSIGLDQNPKTDEPTKKTGGIFGRKKAEAEKVEVKAKEAAPARKKDPLKEALANARDDNQGKSSKTRNGFMLVMILFLLALAVYLFGDLVIGFIPAAEPYLTAYIDMVNNLRLSTQNLIAGIIGE
jgi:hypothetical protein